jgi:hypothetical protein
MLDTFKRIIDPYISEDQKFSMIQGLSIEKVTAQNLADIVTFIKKYQQIPLNYPNSIDVV